MWHDYGVHGASGNGRYSGLFFRAPPSRFGYCAETVTNYKKHTAAGLHGILTRFPNPLRVQSWVKMLRNAKFFLPFF